MNHWTKLGKNKSPGFTLPQYLKAGRESKRGESCVSVKKRATGEQNITRVAIRWFIFFSLRNILLKELLNCSPVVVTTSQPSIHMHAGRKFNKKTPPVMSSCFSIERLHLEWGNHLVLQARDEKDWLLNLQKMVSEMAQLTNLWNQQGIKKCYCQEVLEGEKGVFGYWIR